MDVSAISRWVCCKWGWVGGCKWVLCVHRYVHMIALYGVISVFWSIFLFHLDLCRCDCGAVWILT